MCFPPLIFCVFRPSLLFLFDIRFLPPFLGFRLNRFNVFFFIYILYIIPLLLSLYIPEQFTKFYINITLLNTISSPNSIQCFCYGSSGYGYGYTYLHVHVSIDTEHVL